MIHNKYHIKVQLLFWKAPLYPQVQIIQNDTSKNHYSWSTFHLSKIKGDEYQDAVLAFVVSIEKMNIFASAKTEARWQVYTFLEVILLK